MSTQRERIEKLHADFENAYALPGHLFFTLKAVTQEEYHSDELMHTEDNYVGVVHLRDKECVSTWYIVSPRHREYRGLHDLFFSLATRGGALLPSKIRDTLHAPAVACSWWLTFLWNVMPPRKEDLDVSDGVNHQNRDIFREPFLESATAIEKFLLPLLNEKVGQPIPSEVTAGQKVSSEARASDTGKDTGIPPRATKALAQYEYAKLLCENPSPSIQEVYDAFKQARSDFPEETQERGEVPPNIQTFERYLRIAFRATSKLNDCPNNDTRIVGNSIKRRKDF